MKKLEQINEFLTTFYFNQRFTELCTICIFRTISYFCEKFGRFKVYKCVLGKVKISCRFR